VGFIVDDPPDVGVVPKNPVATHAVPIDARNGPFTTGRRGNTLGIQTLTMSRGERPSMNSRKIRRTIAASASSISRRPWRHVWQVPARELSANSYMLDRANGLAPTMAGRRAVSRMCQIRGGRSSLSSSTANCFEELPIHRLFWPRAIGCCCNGGGYTTSCLRRA
jgi:hypothetical protein